MSLVGVIAILSLDVTRGLVARGRGLGYDTDAAVASSSGAGRFTSTLAPASSATATPGLPYPPLAIVGCTGASVSPIVVTTAYPHGVSGRGVGGLSCIIQGVTGNDAANNIDADPRSRTVGLNSGTLAVPTGPTTLALYGQDPLYGNLVPLVGSGAYTGGGSITPALTDGSILIGRETIREQSAAPRIVFVPTASDWEGRDHGIPTGARNTDRQRAIQQRSLGNEVATFEVHCWGRAEPKDPARDFDAVRDMYHSVANSAHLIFGGQHKKLRGKWDDQSERSTQFIKEGHLFTFALTIDSPIVEYLIPGPTGELPFVPNPTDLNVTVQSPTPEIAEVFDLTITPS